MIMSMKCTLMKILETESIGTILQHIFNIHRPYLHLMDIGGIAYSIHDRVPTQIVFSNSLCFPCVFPVQSKIFPVPIYIICDYYIDETDLADLSNFWGKNGISAANIAVSFTFRIREFTT